MRKVILISMAALAAFALANPGSIIKAIHDEFVKASLKNDANVFVACVKKHMTDDFKFIPKSGPAMNKSQWIASMQQEIKNSHITKFKFELGPTAQTPRGFELKSTLAWAGTGMGPDGKKHAFTGKSTAQELWVASGKTFRCKQIKELTVAMTMDGKPFNIGMPPTVKPGGGQS